MPEPEALAQWYGHPTGTKHNGMRHTPNSNDLLSCLTDRAHTEMPRRLCAIQGAITPLRIEYDTSSRAREQVHDRVTTCRARVRD